MAFYIFKEDTSKEDTSNLDENTINESYAMYLQKFTDTRTQEAVNTKQGSSVIMKYDEFKEYYILKVLGRSAEFTENIARDYQYLTFDGLTQLSV